MPNPWNVRCLLAALCLIVTASSSADEPAAKSVSKGSAKPSSEKADKRDAAEPTSPS